MNLLATVMLLAAVPIGLVVFASWPPRRAVLLVLAGTFCFLPIHWVDVPGFLRIGKSEAISLALLCGIAAFDTQSWRRLRWHWADAFMVAYHVSAPVSSLVNDHGAYDATVALAYRTLATIVPYWIGAIYLRGREAMRAGLWMLFVAGLVYVPFCLFEVRFSPQLHRMVYGEAQHVFSQTMRGGGYRPMVFMEHGIELAFFMASATLAGLVLWRRLNVRTVLGMPMSWCVGAVVVTFVLTKSAAALLLGALGAWLVARTGSPWPRRLLLAIVPTYLIGRIAGIDVIERQLVEWSGWISADRASSLQYRIDSEAALLERFWHHPWFGASPWGFNTTLADAEGEVRTVFADSLWIIALASNGLLGLISVIAILWVPTARVLLPAWRGRRDVEPEFLAAAWILALFLIHSLFNGFLAPIYLALAGGLMHSRVGAARADEPELAMRPAPAGSRFWRRRSAPMEGLAVAPRGLVPRRGRVSSWLLPRRRE